MTRWVLLWLILLSNTLSQAVAMAQPAAEVLQAQVKGVAIDPYSKVPVVILEETTGHRAFPIWIGAAEAQAILRALEGVATPRPMTHALLHNILRALQVEVVSITISDLRESTFYAAIQLRQGAQTHTIDARPSDAIALALDAKAPIFVTQKVIEGVHTVNLDPAALSEQIARSFGMHLQSLTADLANALQLTSTDGVLVAFVEANSQAERSGIRRGDIITAAGGKAIKTLQELLAAFGAQPAGQDIELRVTREQQEQTMRLNTATSQ